MEINVDQNQPGNVQQDGRWIHTDQCGISYDITAKSREELESKFKEGIEKGATHMLHVWDTYDFECSYDYVVFVMQNENVKDVVNFHSMPGYYRTSGVYDLSVPFDQQDTSPLNYR
ncbi:MAG: hypothetical protein SP1CHLAM54_10270 [Chlamydiia bacterium]|nr:hypothetical protein [Chlamydiia bacterium]MCH9615933.1 hypothetical protein [Chlamydiia bacterium]MCH9628664.1 hypothetical protein [Chlamydiia bacterium]